MMDDSSFLDDLPTMLTVLEVAKALRSSESTVRRMLKSGKLASVKVGRRWLVPKSAVQALLTPVKLAGEGREVTRDQLDDASGGKRLFDRASRADRSRSASGGGSGGVRIIG